MQDLCFVQIQLAVMNLSGVQNDTGQGYILKRGDFINRKETALDKYTLHILESDQLIWQVLTESATYLLTVNYSDK